MKTNNFKLKSLLLLTAIALGFTACKKDKSGPEPEPPTPIQQENWTIAQLKAKSTAASVTIEEAGKYIRVKGLVISDKEGKNIDAKSAVIAADDNSAGLIVNFAAAHTFASGQEIEIGVSKQKLIQQNGEIVLDAVPLDSAKSIATGKTITARITTIAEINTNKAAWNGTLVSINATSYSSPDGKYNGTLTITDASGTSSSTVVAGAAFHNKDLQPSISKMTGIVRLNGENVSVNIRNEADVVIGDINRVTTVDFTARDIPAASDRYPALLSGSVLGDESFTASDKQYVYLFGNNITTDVIRVPLSTTFEDVTKGYKTVIVTFAGSKVTGTVNNTRINKQNFLYNLSLTNPFNPETDEYKIGIRWTRGSTVVTGIPTTISEVYKEQGKFFKVTFKVPTDQEFLAAGVPQNILDFGIGFIIVNQSTSSMGLGTQAPILIEKIEVGY